MREGIDLIVVNHRTSQALDEFCQALVENEPVESWTLTIVNVAPLDEDCDVVDKWINMSLPIRTMTHVADVGHARAVNSAVQIGRHDCLAIFNVNARITPGSVDCCYVNLMGEDDWGILGPRLDGPDDIREVSFVPGSAFFIKRAVWDELASCPLFIAAHPKAEGAFLPTQQYHEEMCCYHATAHGYKNVHFGIVSMFHEQQIKPQLFLEMCDMHLTVRN